MIISSGLGKPRQLKVFGPDRIARARGLRGKLVIATGCDLLAPATCRAFLAARPQVCMITGGIGWSGTAFLIQFFHEMAVGGATVRKAWERARVANDETRRVALYTTDRPVPEPSTGRPRVLRGPALVEGFEGDTGNTFTGKWDSLFYRVLLGLGVPAPGGRPGLAFKLNYDFKRQPWPHLVIDPPPGGMRWASGRGLSLEVYVPHRLPSARPLRAVFMVFGSRWEYSVPKLEFRRGWQRIDLPFSAPIWRGRKPGTERWREDTFSLLRLGAFHSIWFGLDSTARRDRGSIYVDNIRLEA